MKLKNILLTVSISVVTTIASVFAYSKLGNRGNASTQLSGSVPINYASFLEKNADSGPADFTAAATAATPAVVHIKTKTKSRVISNNLPKQRSPFDDLFGEGFGDAFGFGMPRQQVVPEQRSSGSGVLISKDGYIVTNNHVVDKADEITITMTDRKTYKATVVGTDASSDIAVLKISADNLPYILYGNSDKMVLGQWVLAVGYPLNLDVTVTAGIISAKSRSIDINRRQSNMPVESFLQTDAAVNPGNSGGALINTSGELVGITAAIASPTGSYAGYSYAIPVNLVKKVVNDIIKFGTVQRAFLGVQYPSESIDDMTDEQRQSAGISKEAFQLIKNSKGVYVMKVMEGGSASVAGLKKGDVIKKVNDVATTTGPELMEQMARYAPGDKITITYLRDGKENTVPVTLKNKLGTRDIVKNEAILDRLGAELENVDKKTAAANDITGGVVVKKIRDGGVLKKTRMQEGFIITSINGQEFKDLVEFKRLLIEGAKNGRIKLEGVYPGYQGTYAYPLNIEEDETDDGE